MSMKKYKWLEIRLINLKVFLGSLLHLSITNPMRSGHICGIVGHKLRNCMRFGEM
jgi:hypothetical protein